MKIKNLTLKLNHDETETIVKALTSIIFIFDTDTIVNKNNMKKELCAVYDALNLLNTKKVYAKYKLVGH
jgi:hypothetical protein